jgi:hypothetical protein
MKVTFGVPAIELKRAAADAQTPFEPLVQLYENLFIEISNPCQDVRVGGQNQAQDARPMAAAGIPCPAPG